MRRQHHTATLLPGGEVLVVGGNTDISNILRSAEIYDPATGTWRSTGSLNAERFGHTATLLPSGEVLVVGGRPVSYTPLTSAEIYDPDTGGWRDTASLGTERTDHTATLLPDGTVLVAGGNTYDDDEIADVEVYDPVSETWSSTGALAVGRFDHTATLLSNGEVLVAGGTAGGGSPNVGPLNSAELYDPVSGSWRDAGSFAVARFAGFTTTLQPDGTVVLAGGYGYGNEAFAAFADVEVYDTATGEWQAGESMLSARDGHTATLLPDGSILLAGGYAQAERQALLASVERYGFLQEVFVPVVLR